MTISHHLSDETIQEYSSGSLTVPMETLIACHLTVCRQCRQKADMADVIGASVFDEIKPTQVKLSALDLIAKAAVAAPSTQEDEICDHAPAALHKDLAGIPRPLARLLPAGMNELDWRRIAPGIKQHNLSDQHRKHGAFQLLHLEPGVVLSAHSHNDRELTFLVQGSYRDEIGRFSKGDIADLDGHQETHQPIVDSEEPCIALIATHSPVRYTGMVGKIMQPFVGI